MTLKTIGFQEILDASGTIVSAEPVSEFVFHPEHNHWHITAVALYETRAAQDDGTGGSMGAVIGGQSLKTAFCLIDWIKLEGNSNNNGRTYADCKPDLRQGLSVGWVDQYHQALEGQEVKITNIPAGTYYLLTTATPTGTSSRRPPPTTRRGRASNSLATTREGEGHRDLPQPVLGWAVRRADTEPLTIGRRGRVGCSPARRSRSSRFLPWPRSSPGSGTRPSAWTRPAASGSTSIPS